MKSLGEVQGAQKIRSEHQQALKQWISGKIISAPKKYREMPVDEWDDTLVEGDYVCEYVHSRETCHQ
jgi:hypothetical protein